MQLYLLHALYKWQIRSGDFRGFKELTDRIDDRNQADCGPVGRRYRCTASYAVTRFFAGRQSQGSPARADCPGRARFTRRNSTTRVLGRLYRDKTHPGAITCGCWDTPIKQRKRPKKPSRRRRALQSSPHALLHIDVLFGGPPLQRGLEKSGRADSPARRPLRPSTTSLPTRGLRWAGKAALAILRGDLSRGIELLQIALAALHEDGYELYRPQLQRDRWQPVSCEAGQARTRVQHDLRGCHLGRNPCVAYSTSSICYA